jgi:hypothetical protein
MIRLTTPDDITALIALAEASGLFEPSQTEYLAQMLDEHFSNNNEPEDFWLTDYDHEPVGMAYVAPERMTEGTWNLVSDRGASSSPEARTRKVSAAVC